MSSKGHVVVIGSGASGTGCARALTQAGWTVTQIDNDRWGGTCLWRGCIPKKSLYHSATTLRTVRDAEQFGIKSRSIGFDWQTVLAWKWHAQETYAGDQESLAASHGIHVVHGTATFTGPRTVRVDGTTYNPDHIVIATGSEPIIPQLPGMHLADTSADALRYPNLPESIVIVGGGFIALEFAGLFSAFGVRVTVVTRPSRILEMLDEELAAVAVARLSAEGVRFLTGCTVNAVIGVQGQLTVEATQPDGTEARIECQRVLMAVGRQPALTALDLVSGEVDVDERGHVIIDSFMRTSNPAVWCVGDAAGGQMQTPVAHVEGAAVAHSINTGQPMAPDYAASPVTCFTNPQLASVGLTELKAKTQGNDVIVSHIGVGSTGAGVISAETDGFVKLVAAAETGLILGVQIAGNTASDLIFAAGIAIRSGMTAQELSSTIAVHPSLAEALAWSGQTPQG